MAEITLDNFGATTKEQSNDRGTFQAPTLTATITDPDGNVVAEVTLEARAYTPNASGKGGCGWFGSIDKSDPARYKGTVPVTGQVRLSVAGLKISKSDTVRFK
jgi:hypothetical protein